jgi:hypothetical protein
MTMVYCGDLHRYKQQQKRRQQQQQDVASDIYMRAGHLQPWNGLAWNQLAVICSSSSGSGSNSSLEAAFYYMRAASSRVAFPAAGENLRILLEKTRSVVSSGAAAAAVATSHLTTNVSGASSDQASGRQHGRPQRERVPPPAVLVHACHALVGNGLGCI